MSDSVPASLHALSPLDGRYAGQTAALRPWFSEAGLMHQRVRVEVEWLIALSNEPAIAELPPLDADARAALRALVDGFSGQDAARIKALEASTNHDVKAVEYFIKEKLRGRAEFARALEFVHFACTSEDINNLAYSAMLGGARDTVLLPALDSVLDCLTAMAHTHADAAMLARTHGQSASPTTMGKEIANVIARLRRQRRTFAALLLPGKINGAVGNFNAHVAAYPEVDWPTLAERFVTSLGLEYNPYTTQIEPHDAIAEYCDVLRRIAVIGIDLCRDLWGYIALGYFRQQPKAGEVGSSTMPHKVNPIDFENAEGNFGLVLALCGHFSEKLPISRWQRDLTDSTVLRSLGTALGHALIAFESMRRGLGKLELDRARLADELERAPEVLAEAVQTVMRRYGLPEPYEQLKALTRGRGIEADVMRRFIEGLALPAEARARLLQLTPARYIGLAAQLAANV
jgi:adenylosuccinate lyase